MAKSLGNISYNGIMKDREKVSRREGISKDIFEKLVQRINICGFENSDGNITVYFNSDDLELFDSIINSSADNFILNKVEQIAKRLDSFDERLKQLNDFILEEQQEKMLRNAINSINERFDSIEEYLSEYCSMISEMLNNKNNTAEKTDKKVSIVEVDGCSSRINEMMDKFDVLYGDIIRNLAYLRSDLKISIGRKSIPKRKKAFFILAICFFTTVLLIKYRFSLLRWFL